jgi:hypothetical protein
LLPFVRLRDQRYPDGDAEYRGRIDVRGLDGLHKQHRH